MTDWAPELAAALDRLVPLDDGSRADWGDVVARTGGRRRPRLAHERRKNRLVLVAVVLFLVLVGTAMTMYYVLGGPAGLVIPRAGGFAVLDTAGHPREIGRWRCPRDLFCGDVAGWALSQDGHLLALSTNEVGARSTYPGLHIIDLATGSDRRIPALRRYYGAASLGTLEKVVREQMRVFGGCITPSYLAWSPDGSRLAYTCWVRNGRRRLYTIRLDGTGRRLIPTHHREAFSPTWSPDGTRIAFSTGETPSRSAVYVVDLDGRHERRLAAGALPAWSPDGRTIAYVSPGCGSVTSSRGGVRLVTPDGRDETPSSGGCPGIGPQRAWIASWSPDGGRLAVKTATALYVMNADGTGLERVRRGRFLVYGPGVPFDGLLRPLWRPS